MSSTIAINPRVVPTTPPPGELDADRLTFGKRFTPHMFMARYREGQGWYEATICPYGPITLDPAALVLHYGQETFEGLKAYLRVDDEIGLFRLGANAERLNVSNRRLCIPEIDPDFFVAAVETLVDIERDWVPRVDGSSLYIRPTVIATEAGLGVRASREYLFYIITGPVGPYFGTFDPVRICTPADGYTRAAPGGIGIAKAGGNYAASLLPARQAAAQGYQQVLYLDAVERRYIEELGGMNVFVVWGGRLLTPPLTDTILAGVTRDALLILAKDLGLEVEETPIAIDDLIAAIDSGEVDELFASGTAAVATAIGVLGHEGRQHTVGDGRAGEVTRKLVKRLTDIQIGRGPDPHDWGKIVARRFAAA